MSQLNDVKGKATAEKLDQLHGVLAQHMVNRIKTGEVTAAELREAREFLKDNKVQGTLVPGKPLHDLASSLPFAGTESYAQ